MCVKFYVKFRKKQLYKCVFVYENLFYMWSCENRIGKFDGEGAKISKKIRCGGGGGSPNGGTLVYKKITGKKPRWGELPLNGGEDQTPKDAMSHFLHPLMRFCKFVPRHWSQ